MGLLLLPTATVGDMILVGVAGETGCMGESWVGVTGLGLSRLEALLDWAVGATGLTCGKETTTGDCREAITL